jgi:hypothetical protein
MQLIAGSQTQEAIEKKVSLDKSEHYDWNDNQFKHHSDRGFLRMFPTMATPLGEVYGVPRRLL